MKGVLLIIDGLGDRPCKALDGRTPLEAARTPVLDRLASDGRYGLVDPVGPGETPSTYSGAGVLMGMVPAQAGRLGRGSVEAAGLGLVVGPGDVALRANFATLEATPDGLQVIDRRAGRIKTGADELASALNQIELGHGCSANLRPTHQHRAVLVLTGPDLDPAISDTDPGDRPLPAPLLECRPLKSSAEVTAGLLNRFVLLAHECLDSHPLSRQRIAAGKPPANGIITRGAGSLAEVDNIVRTARLRASVVSGCNTVRGLANIYGFDTVMDPSFTGDQATNLEGKISSALEQLESHDVVFVHIKAPDICAHDRAPLAKRDFLERLDAVLAPLAEQEIAIAVAADHTTDSNSGSHTDDPVPALLRRPNDRQGGQAVKFGESACRRGNAPRQLSHDFLQGFLQALT